MTWKPGPRWRSVVVAVAGDSTVSRWPSAVFVLGIGQRV
jgi:hypothetical protein